MKTKLFTFFLATILCAGNMMATEQLLATLDFSSNDAWQFPTQTKGIEAASYSDGNYSIILEGTTGNGYRWNNFNPPYLIIGKKGASLTLPAFPWKTTKIVTTGNADASANTVMNIFVGENAVSSATTGSIGTNTYPISEGYQNAGNAYAIKILSAHNAQFTKIEIYGETGNTTPVVPSVYIVTFVDWDGTILKTEEVAEGGSATAPENPTRDECTFIGWSDGFDNVTSDMTITARYECNMVIEPSKIERVQIGDLYYNLDVANQTAEVTSNGSNYAGDIVIPSFITYNAMTYTVTSICKFAFYSCTGLTSVEIPNSVSDSIGYGAFAHCDGLTSVIIGNSVTSIGEYAFSDCSSLTSVTIGNSVTSIGDYAFWYCYDLTSVTIPNSVTNIGNAAFSQCTALTSVTIGNSVTRIGEYAFSGCTGLTSISVDNYNATYDSRDNCNAIIESATNALIVGCKTTVIPNSVTSIGTYAFSGCTGLTSIAIPNSVTSIGYYAFTGCYSLTDIYAACGDLERVKQLFDNDSRVKYAPLPYIIIVNATNGNVSIPQNKCEDELYATPDYGYHFTQWSDGDMDNPRIIELTQDTTFSAEFAKNIYTIQLSCDETIGQVSGAGSYEYLDTVELNVTTIYGYHFDHWSDGNRDNPRSYIVRNDTYLTAIFAPNRYSLAALPNPNGYVSGTGTFDYLSKRTINAIPNYGYHFVQWNDGNKDNPRSLVLTQDTIFSAEYAVDRSGKCGDNFALTWEYDATNKVLTINGDGTLNSNYTFGVEAPTAVEKLVISEGVNTIGNSAYAGYSTLKHLSIASSVQTIYEQAFYNCTGLENIYSFRQTPPTAYSNTFDGIEKFECLLHVLSASIDMYKAATGWRDFYYVQTIDAEEVTETITDVNVTPSDNEAVVTWPTSANAVTYSLQITKDGVVFCTLIFNAYGQLAGVAFAPGRNGTSCMPAAVLTSNGGLRFTVIGLSSGTNYHLTIDTKDANDQVIASYAVDFSTTDEVSEGLDQITNDQSPITNKIIIDGQILILRGNRTYTLTGAEVK